MGRFKHEGAGNIVNGDGRFVVYQGDDERFDYVYRFVTEGKVDTREPRRQQGSARSRHAVGGAIQLPTAPERGSRSCMARARGSTRSSASRTRATSSFHARLAADLVGATKMDRPEDVDVNLVSGKVYVVLTNNSKRKADQVDAANPRAENKFGHIIEITPAGGDHAAPTFTWEILLKCGDPSIADVGAAFNPADQQGRLVRHAGQLSRSIPSAGSGSRQTATRRRAPGAPTASGPSRPRASRARHVALLLPGAARSRDVRALSDARPRDVLRRGSASRRGRQRRPNATPANFDAPSTRWPELQGRRAAAALDRRHHAQGRRQDRGFEDTYLALRAP